MKIHLTSWLQESSQGESLTKNEANNRMLNFNHLKKHSKKQIDGYIKNGENTPEQNSNKETARP